MDGIITEKNYPIQGLWILKSILNSLLTSIIVVPFLLFWCFLCLLSFGKSKDFISYIFPIISAVFFLCVNTIVTAILRRATFHYSIEGDFLTLRQGILSRQQRHIPYGVIQNLFVKQDLFDRIFGLASLTVENASQGAGSLATPQEQQMEMVRFSGNKVIIPGLTKANAEILKGIILQKIKENPIEDSQSGL